MLHMPAGGVDKNLALCYGYQLIKELGRRSEGYFEFKEGTLYPALHRLEKGYFEANGSVCPVGRREDTTA